MRIETHSREETQELGKRLAGLLKPGDVIALEGDLGSGKTELVRGVMLALNPSQVVRSPSFSLVNSYNTPNFPVHHFDFYRLHSADDLFEVGYEEYLSPEAVCFIEWAQMFEEALPKGVKIIHFVEASEDVRVIESDFEF